MTEIFKKVWDARESGPTKRERKLRTESETPSVRFLRSLRFVVIHVTAAARVRRVIAPAVVMIK